jgi:hypothetical protein
VRLCIYKLLTFDRAFIIQLSQICKLQNTVREYKMQLAPPPMIPIARTMTIRVYALIVIQFKYESKMYTHARARTRAHTYMHARIYIYKIYIYTHARTHVCICIAKFYSFVCDEYNSMSFFKFSSRSITNELDFSFDTLIIDSTFGTKLLPIFLICISSLTSLDLYVSKTIYSEINK